MAVIENNKTEDETSALLGLTHIQGMGPRTLKELLSLGLATQELWQAKPALLRTLF